MVTPRFDHRESGTDEALWLGSAVLESATRLDLSPFNQLVVVAAHPDDESLGAGGLLAAATGQGLFVTVVIATLGEASHPASTTHVPQDLKTIRRAEVLLALESVAPTAAAQVLGLPDGLLGAHLPELTDAIVRVAAGGRVSHLSGGTLIVAPWRGDGHPDHRAAGEAAAAAAHTAGATLLEYPIWAWHWAVPDGLPAELVRLDLDDAQAGAKRRAIGSHRSQTEPLSDQPGDEPIVSAEFTAHFDRPFEIFIAGSTAVPGADGTSLSGSFFDEFYGDSDDPWGFGTRWYERRKRDLTMAILPRERFRRAFEPGCSIGILTAELAARCDEVVATDISQIPLRAAQRRLAGNPHVDLRQIRVPQEWPSGLFDLIVLSEMAYYCGESDLHTLIDATVAALTPDGVLLACHWRHSVPEYPLNGDQVHRRLRAHPGLGLLAEHREEDFLLEVYTRPPSVSVARATGLLP